MAHVSILDDAVGCVAGETIIEGRFVVLGASGVHRDLPVATIAPSGTTKDVYMAFNVPDLFPRPTPNGMFQYYDQIVDLNPRNATEHDQTHDFENAWLIGPSVLPTGTVASGWKCAAHRGGYYKLMSGEYTFGAGIAVNGAKVRIGAGGKIEHDLAGTQSIGAVREYDPADGSITISVKEL